MGFCPPRSVPGQGQEEGSSHFVFFPEGIDCLAWRHFAPGVLDHSLVGQPTWRFSAGGLAPQMWSWLLTNRGDLDGPAEAGSPQLPIPPLGGERGKGDERERKGWWRAFSPSSWRRVSSTALLVFLRKTRPVRWPLFSSAQLPPRLIINSLRHLGDKSTRIASDKKSRRCLVRSLWREVPTLSLRDDRMHNAGMLTSFFQHGRRREAEASNDGNSKN